VRLLEPSLLLWRKGLTKDAYVRALPPISAGHDVDGRRLIYLLFFAREELMLSLIDATENVRRVPALVSDRMGKAIREHALSSFQLSTSFFRAGLATDMSISLINPDLYDRVLAEVIRKRLYRQGVLALESERPVPLP
jgi:hypothetical protein